MRATDDACEPWLFLEIAAIQVRAVELGVPGPLWREGQEQVVEGCRPFRLSIGRQKPTSLFPLL